MMQQICTYSKNTTQAKESHDLVVGVTPTLNKTIKSCTNIVLNIFDIPIYLNLVYFNHFYHRGTYLNMFTTKNVQHKKIVIHTPRLIYNATNMCL